ncbi:MAG: precorrin-2 dehydrogenase/sirohydrochlorin ferrochelatase family protein [Parvibaculales bacterium]
MLPIILDVTNLTLAIVGSGPQARRRLQMVDAAGAAFVRVYAEQAEAEMVDLAGDRLIETWPSDAEIAACHVVYVANVEDALAEAITAIGRAHKTLVNVEDVKPLCDFHVPAIVRRGDMLLTASTGGQSPGLARRLKTSLEGHFPEQWSERLEVLARKRDQWRQEGADFGELISRTNQVIDDEGWLS